MTRTESLLVLAKQGDMNAKEALVCENSGLIWAVARRFLGRGVELDDLYQLGCVGFLKAIDGFDSSYGTQFSTYAVPKIAGEIRRFIRDDGAIKVSRAIKETAMLIYSACQEITLTLGHEPSLSEIAQKTGLSIEDIVMAQAATSTPESIQKETGEEGFSLEQTLTDTLSEEQMVEKLAIKQAVEHLPEREKKVINLRYFHGLTQQKTAAILNISQVQVSRIEKKAIEMLRSQIT